MVIKKKSSTKKVIGISGYSNSGKTTLLKKIILLFDKQGFHVGVIKHAHHDIDIDIPGKDSYQLRKAGAVQTIVACDTRYAMICETPAKPTGLWQLIETFSGVDLILVEGFKDEKIPKIICHRDVMQQTLFIDDFAIAIASDIALKSPLPWLDINRPEQIVEFIKNYLFKQ